MSDHYILAADGKTPVACDLMTWANAFEQRDLRRVARTELADDVHVSTVFLGLDHSFGDGPPVLWETMIFGGPHSDYQERYTSYDDAVAGHEKAVALATSNARTADAGQKRTCTTCLLCLREDYGYSNYTTEGTTLECLAGLNPELTGEEDETWSEERMAALAPILDVALTCPRYREGAPATLDVDHEGIDSGSYDLEKGWVSKPVTPEGIIAGGYTDDREAAELLAARFNS